MLPFAVADYGNILTSANDLALARGTGNYNPSPWYYQSINRGPAADHSLQYYNSTAAPPPDPSTAPSFQYSAIDRDNTEPYEVGVTQFHPQPPGAAGRPDFKDSRGSDQYQVWAVMSMNMTPSVLLNLFFSKDNVDYLQGRIIDEVQRIQGERISRQNDDDLLVIMRATYLYGIQGWLPMPDPSAVYARGEIANPPGPDGRPLAYGGMTEAPTSLENQLTRLNQSVLEQCVKQVLSGILMYKQYYKDASSLPMPLSQPVMTSSKGSRTLMPNLGFQSGHEMSIAASSYNQRYNII